MPGKDIAQMVLKAGCQFCWGGEARLLRVELVAYVAGADISGGQLCAPAVAYPYTALADCGHHRPPHHKATTTLDYISCSSSHNISFTANLSSTFPCSDFYMLPKVLRAKLHPDHAPTTDE